MWCDYFPNAQIIGCDILPEVQFKETRIQTFITDQSNVDSLNNLIESLKSFGDYADIILDDGSHIEAHQVISFKTLWKFVKPNGLYIIEDVSLSHIERISKLHEECNFIDAEHLKTYKGRNHWDNFVVFKKIPSDVSM